jgi:hypothetical protein
MMVLFAGAAGVSYVVQVLTWNTYGPVTQGRYMMPLLVSLPLLAAFIVERRALAAAQTRSLARLIGVTVLPIHLGSLVFTMVRWQSGLPTPLRLGLLNPLKGEWHPPLGSVLPLVAMAVGLVLFGVLVWWGPARAMALPDLDEAALEVSAPRQGPEQLSRLDADPEPRPRRVGVGG